MTFKFDFFSSLCDVRWESSQLNSTLKSLKFRLSRVLLKVFFIKRTRYTYNGGTRTKSRRREKFVEFYPVSRYSVIYVFFLSLSLFTARVCVAMMMMMSWFWGRSSLAFEFLKRWCENDMRFLVLLLARRLSLSKTRPLSKRFRFCASLVLSLNV